MVFFWNNSAQSTKISNVHDNCAKTHVLLIEKQHIRLQMLKDLLIYSEYFQEILQESCSSKQKRGSPKSRISGLVHPTTIKQYPRINNSTSMV